jgi:pSer/pThr/pTyr-binding forkhead associated (FHA) protein
MRTAGILPAGHLGQQEVVMKTYLTFLNGDYEGQTYQVFDETTIGRNTVCELPIRDFTVSASHCRLSLSKGCVMLEDLGSTNGTHINGQRIHTAQLNSGDLVIIGGTRLSVEVVPEEQEPEYETAPGNDGVSLALSATWMNCVTQRIVGLPGVSMD